MILVCSYGRESLIKACRDMNIATYEVQHGAITKNHLGYHYPFSLKKQLVPEFFLIYGEYWKTSVEYSRAIKNFKVIGNNYLYEQVKNRKMKKEKIILVLSQRTISNKIKMFVHDMSKYLPDDIKIAIKPHPGEIDTYEYEYKDENIYVIKSRYVNIYDLMAKSEWVCGVYSTAIFESIAFSCKVIILKINGWEDLYALVEKGDAVLLDRPEEIVSAINRSRIANPELYFAKSASFNL